MGDDMAFWIDRDYDRANANRAGGSRFANYVAIKTHFFRDAGCWDDDSPSEARFAETVWRIATGPVMAPGYVRSNQRILSHDVQRSDWDGSLVARIDVITPGAQQLASVSYSDAGDASPASTSWPYGTRWQDWPIDGYGDNEAYCWPSSEDLVKRGYALPMTSYQFPVPTTGLSRPPATEPDIRTLVNEADACVRELVRQLNRRIDPVLDAIARS